MTLLNRLSLCLLLSAQLFEFVHTDCNQPTFHNTRVAFNSIIEIRVIGCLTPEVVPAVAQRTDENPTEIIISHQNIPSINQNAVADFEETLMIVLKDNNINTIKQEAFVNLPLLYSVIILNNKIGKLEAGCFYNLPSLLMVDLGSNLIEAKAFELGTFQDLPELRQVTLRNNRLVVFNQLWFIFTPRLWSLDLARNLIRTIPKGAFITLPSINTLDFTSNQIEHIDKDAFNGLKKLKTLLLGNNRLQRLHVDFSYASLNRLEVYYNKLTYIPDTVLQDIEESVLTFCVFGNPIQCPCYDKIIRWSDELNIDDPFTLTDYHLRITNLNQSVLKAHPVCVRFADNHTKCYEYLKKDATQELHTLFDQKLLIGLS